MEKLQVQAFDHKTGAFSPKILALQDCRVTGLEDSAAPAGEYYLSPGFIDSHAHVYDGGDNLSTSADRIGLDTGVHLVVDAGSSGSMNFPCFKKYVIPAAKTPVKAFLNISRIGLVTKQPYFDPRNLDIDAAVRCIREDAGETLLGIKVLTSGLIVEDQGLLPLQKAVEAADQLGCRMMAHLAEGPPSNAEVLPYLRRGDIISHCFHGMPNIEAVKKTGANLDFCKQDNVLWNPDGTPTKPLEDALSRGVLLDVGHGAASMDQSVARAAINAGVRKFSISTDAHIRNVDTVVRSLPLTMSKFLAMGLTLEEVVAGVTTIPAKQLGLSDWCVPLTQRATLFRVRPCTADDPAMLDARQTKIDGGRIIEPVAVVRDSRLEPILQGWSLSSSIPS